MVQKASRPCKICRGKQKVRCMFCGWKAKKPGQIAYRDLSPDEQLKVAGKRNSIQFLHQLDASSTRADNCSTHNLAMDNMLAKHREWAFDIYKRVRILGEDAKIVAKEEQLTQSQIEKVVRLVSYKVNTGKMEYLPDQDVWVKAIYHRWKVLGESIGEIARTDELDIVEVTRILKLAERKLIEPKFQSTPVVVKPEPPKAPIIPLKRVWNIEIVGDEDE